MNPNPCLVAPSESLPLAREIGAQAQIPLAGLEERAFEGGEFKLRPLECLRGRPAFVVQSLIGSQDVPVGTRLLRLLFLLLGVRDAGCSPRIAVIPYMAFARKDRRTQPHDPVTSRYVAELLEAAGADGIVALDVHNPAALDNAFRVPVDHLSAAPLLVDHFARRLGCEPLCVVSPDVGGIKRAQRFQELLGAHLGRPTELAFVEKRRALGVVSGGQLAGTVAGRHVIVLDDLCATGGTLIRAAQACRAAGAAAVHAAVTHAPLPEGLAAVLSADCIADVTHTDSAAAAILVQAADTPRLHVLPIAPLLGQALRRIVLGKALDPMLTDWPVSLEDDSPGTPPATPARDAEPV